MLRGLGTAFKEELKPLLAATSATETKQPAVERLLELLDNISPSADQQMIFTHVTLPLATKSWTGVHASPSSSTGPALLGALVPRFVSPGTGTNVRHRVCKPFSLVFPCPDPRELEVHMQMTHLPTWAWSSLPLVHSVRQRQQQPHCTLSCCGSSCLEVSHMRLHQNGGCLPDC